MPTTTTTEGLIKPAPTDTFVAGVSFIGQSLDKIDNALAQRARLANPVFASSDTTKPTIISRAIANQSANLEEWQNTAGTALARVTNGGHVISQAGLFGGPASDSVATGGTNVMRPGSEGAVGLVVRGVSGQTANLTEWQDSAGVVRSNVTKDGSVIVPGTVSINSPAFSATGPKSAIDLYAPAADSRGLVVHGIAGQTAPLIEVQNSAGDLMTSIDANGTYTTKAVVQMLPGNSGTRPLLVRGTLGQTANLTEWQNIAGTVLASVSPGGAITSTALKVLNGTADNSLFIQHGRVDAVAAIIRGATNQTANLVEIANAGGLLSIFDSNSNFRVRANVTQGFDGSSNLSISTGTVSDKGLVVRGAASQTANLTEWQNSGGGVMAYVSNQGYIKVGGATTFVEHRGVLGGAVAGSVNSLHVNIDGTIYRIPFYS